MGDLLRDPLVVRALATIALIIVVAALRYLGRRVIRGKADILDEGQRQKLFYMRSALGAVLIIGLLFIWLGQLQNLLLSLTAVVVAIAIATKELLMCIGGFFLRAGAGLFSVGDWIEVNGVRGEVTDHSLLSTSLLELEPTSDGHDYSGRSLEVPNSLFLTNPVRNENFARNYALHRFSITTEQGIEVRTALSWLTNRSKELCAPFEDVARRYNSMIERKLGVDMRGPDAVVGVRTTELGKVQFQLLVFCPTSEVSNIELTMMSELLDLLGTGSLPIRTPNPDHAV